VWRGERAKASAVHHVVVFDLPSSPLHASTIPQGECRVGGPDDRKRRWRPGLLELDALVDDTLYRVGGALSRAWDSFSVFMDRFGVSGVRRGAVEVLSDAATFAVLAGAVMLAFARPAIELSRVDWRADQEFAVTFLDRTGVEIGRRGVLHSEAVPIEEMPDYLVKATLATEDRRFFEHWGIDVQGTVRALTENARAAGVVQGGSSLTQQLAKNLFLSNERSLERKIKEAFLAIWLEVNLSKAEILRLYLDRAYMGAGAFGVEAAARAYFGKSVREVTLAEAAMLAGLFKAPSRFSPHANLPAARARANQVLANMVDAGFLTEGQVHVARRNPATPIPRRGFESPDYFLDWAFAETRARLPRGDRTLVVRTTIDMSLQRRAEQALESALRQHGENFAVTQGSIVTLDTDGAVRIMVGGRDYGQSQYNRAATGGRQTGSAFKPFVYLVAFMNGYSARTVMSDSPITIGNWSPRNYSGGYSGNMTLTEALVRSINTIPVRLTQQMGRSRVIAAMRQMGIRGDLPNTPSLPLGVAELTPLEMAQGYAHFQSGGRAVQAHGIIDITNSDGVVVYRRERDVATAEQLFPAQSVADLNGAMSQIVEWGTGTRAQLDGASAAGKTGTTQSYRDAWFVGYTGNFTSAVWLGNDDNTVTNRMTGGSLPAMVWQEVMTMAQATVTEPRPIFGLSAEPPRRVARATRQAQENARRAAEPPPVPPRQILTLNRRAADVLTRIERRLSDAAPLSAPALAPAVAGPAAPARAAALAPN
jgi:penicillin-binding protein 1A